MSTKNEEESKKRRTSDVYSNTYSNGEWSDRDALPTRDPIGDVDEKQDLHKQFKKDQEKYMDEMKPRTMFSTNKNFEVKDTGGPYRGIDHTKVTIETPKKKKCDCGIAKTYKNPSLKMHSDWCELRK